MYTQNPEICSLVKFGYFAQGGGGGRGSVCVRERERESEGAGGGGEAGRWVDTDID